MQSIPQNELRILLVDDHEDTLAVLKRLLRLEGHFVKATHESRYALEIAKTETFELVLSDIGLPDMDGCALLAELRAIQPMKAIALTGYGMPDEVLSMGKAGFDDVLIKPITFEALIKSISHVFANGDTQMTAPSEANRPNCERLMMKLYNSEKTLGMLTSFIERQKLENQISHIRHRLSQLGCHEE